MGLEVCRLVSGDQTKLPRKVEGDEGIPRPMGESAWGKRTGEGDRRARQTTHVASSAHPAMVEISKLPELVLARVLLLHGVVDVLHLRERASADADAEAPRRAAPDFRC